MSKAAAPCSRCARTISASTSEKASSRETLKIECILEDPVLVSSNSVTRVKRFKKFLNYDLTKLSIVGQLYVHVHPNEVTHTKLMITYRDKTTRETNYLEINAFDNTNNKDKKAERGCYTDEISGVTYQCCSGESECYPTETNGAVSLSTDTPSGKNQIKKYYAEVGDQAVLKVTGKIVTCIVGKFKPIPREDLKPRL